MITRCEIVLAVPKSHPLHQEEGETNIVEELLHRIKAKLETSRLTRKWHTELVNHHQCDTLANGLDHAIRQSDIRGGAENRFVLIAIPGTESSDAIEVRKVQRLFRQWPHNARGVVILVDVAGKKINLNFFATAAKQLASGRALAILGTEMDNRKLTQVVSHLADV